MNNNNTVGWNIFSMLNEWLEALWVTRSMNEKGESVGCWCLGAFRTNRRVLWSDRWHWCCRVCAAGFSGDIGRSRVGCPETPWSWTRRPCLTWRRPTATPPPSAEHACTSKEDNTATQITGLKISSSWHHNGSFLRFSSSPTSLTFY